MFPLAFFPSRDSRGTHEMSRKMLLRVIYSRRHFFFFPFRQVALLSLWPPRHPGFFSPFLSMASLKAQISSKQNENGRNKQNVTPQQRLYAQEIAP